MLRSSRKLSLLVVAFLGFILVGGELALASQTLEFPLRAKYEDLSPIETDELVSIFDKAIIVDARNKVEYEVVNIVGAHNLLVGKMKEDDLLALRGKDDAAPLVFYCNGTTCSKSYKAAKKAVSWGFKNARVYDSGIFHWAQQQPTRTRFFGSKLTEETVKTAFISTERLNEVSLSPADFITKAKSGEYTVIDIRDPNERSEDPIRLSRIKVLPMDTLVDLLEKESKVVPKKNLLIMGNVGKQVKWVQYYLENEGVTNYYFLKGGVLQWKKDGFDPSGNKK